MKQDKPTLVYPFSTLLRNLSSAFFTPSPAASPSITITAPLWRRRNSFNRRSDCQSSSVSSLGIVEHNTDSHIDSSDDADLAPDSDVEQVEARNTRPILQPHHISALNRQQQQISYDFTPSPNVLRRSSLSDIFNMDLDGEHMEDQRPMEMVTSPKVMFRKMLYRETKPQLKAVRRVTHELQNEVSPFDSEMGHELASWFTFKDDELLGAKDPLGLDSDLAPAARFYPSQQHMITDEIYRKNKLVSEANKAWSRRTQTQHPLNERLFGFSPHLLAMTPLHQLSPQPLQGTKRKSTGDDAFHTKRKAVSTSPRVANKAVLSTSDDLERMRL
ncbi:hypothetical protein BABINDRAFT_161461 [Babjeviella inositovora NRRL Y-12698]|uniref:Uncharacterized protein n=1 Tax=Babjeviella inositovora NRRL Y-12698 TaxID=984486 RepID=A0A1E3QQ26_9ASCO|nr:uncharacterized protein BABINDRAFT_161461 [Babjeviella inositovora NRRL Y-12698]ODQ79761.1 hypothetical protein BABINDRAFT_161461 [Babjeviella inositovora NRRL Y-12698]